MQKIAPKVGPLPPYCCVWDCQPRVSPAVATFTGDIWQCYLYNQTPGQLLRPNNGAADMFTSALRIWTFWRAEEPSGGGENWNLLSLLLLCSCSRWLPPAAASQLLITFVNKPSGEENLFLNHITDGRGWWGKFITDIICLLWSPRAG